MRTMWLTMAIAPYLLIAGIDAWMHEAGRKVPRTEQFLHAGLALALVVFLPAVFLQRPVVAAAALLVFLVLLVWDERVYHQQIALPEKRVHVASWVALAGFVLTWALVDV